MTADSFSSPEPSAPALSFIMLGYNIWVNQQKPWEATKAGSLPTLASVRAEPLKDKSSPIGRSMRRVALVARQCPMRHSPARGFLMAH
jgi:hypothetical protein